MAKLIVNAEDLPRLSRRIVEKLQRGTMGYEALCGWTGSSHQSVACQLYRLKQKGLVEHDGRRPRTWALAGQLPKTTEHAALLTVDIETRKAIRKYAGDPVERARFEAEIAARKLKEPEAA